jgi:outer membrane receptor protein involved in Fe transport
VEYQATANTMVYATAAKGFRPAGASLRVPFLCDANLVDLGYYDDSGAPQQPTTYDPDSVWSYEIGTKNRLLGNRLTLNASLYDVQWTDIQLTVVLPDCGSSFVDNLANATARGFDLDFAYQATDELLLQGAVGYNKATFDEDATSPNGATVIYDGGSSIPNAGPPWSLSLSAEYSTRLASGQRVYVRADDTYSTEWRRYGPTDPGSSSYDPRLQPRPAYNLLNLRVGAQLSGFDVSFFVQNVMDAAPDIFLYADGDTQDWHDITVRPRTYGLTLAWRM